MKPATKRLAGPVVEVERAADLLDPAQVHHHDALGHGHGFHLVVGDVDRGGPEPLVQRLDLGPHLHPELGVEVGERLVEEEHLRVAHDGAAHGDPLALAARELARQAVEQVREAQNLGGAIHPLADHGLVRLAQPQAEAHVLAHRHVRVEGVVLKHHGDVAGLRRHVVHHLIADRDLAVVDVLEAGDHPEQRRLAAARRADQDQELAVLDVDRDAVDHSRIVEGLVDLADRYRCHGLSSPLIP